MPLWSSSRLVPDLPPWCSQATPVPQSRATLLGHPPFRSLLPFFHRSWAAGLLPEDRQVSRAIFSSSMGCSWPKICGFWGIPGRGGKKYNSLLAVCVLPPRDRHTRRDTSINSKDELTGKDMGVAEMNEGILQAGQ